MSKLDIDRGIEADALRGSGWPPSSPAFRAMCLGIPPIAIVRTEIVRKDESVRKLWSPFSRLVYSKIPPERRSRFWAASGETFDRMLADAYEIAHTAVMRGEAMPESIAGTIDAPKAEKPVRASPEAARPYIDTLNQLARTVVMEQAEFDANMDQIVNNLLNGDAP